MPDIVKVKDTKVHGRRNSTSVPLYHSCSRIIFFAHQKKNGEEKGEVLSVIFWNSIIKQRGIQFFVCSQTFRKNLLLVAVNDVKTKDL